MYRGLAAAWKWKVLDDVMEELRVFTHYALALPHGVVAIFTQALGKLARLIGGTEYGMTTVSRL